MKVTKMHGAGNDYIYINCFEETVDDPASLCVKLSDRHFGVGGDGIILIMPSNVADFRMRMFNSLDGSEGMMCGNAIRCVGKYVYDRKMTDKKEITVETASGIKTLLLNVEDGVVKTVRVDMGEPILKASDIPVKSELERFIDSPITAGDKTYNFTCVSMGNPHAITYVEDTDSLKIEDIGPLFETHEIFPERANIEFIQCIDENSFKMRVWERGSGETLACGTGACASLVATNLLGKCGRKASVILLGGTLTIEWSEADNHVYMTGPAETVFDAEVLI